MSHQLLLWQRMYSKCTDVDPGNKLSLKDFFLVLFIKRTKRLNYALILITNNIGWHFLLDKVKFLPNCYYFSLRFFKSINPLITPISSSWIKVWKNINMTWLNVKYFHHTLWGIVEDWNSQKYILQIIWLAVIVYT